MPKQPTYPHLFDDCKKISISSLQKAGLLIPGKRISTEMTWSVQGEVTSRVYIMVNMHEAMPHHFDPYMELRYIQNGKPVHYTIRITSKPANIGKGVVYYFVCDKTNKKCRILYLVDTYFAHRSYALGCMYAIQSLSKKNRDELTEMGKDLESDQVYDEIHSKHFKKKYKNKLTKRYTRLLKKLE